MNIDHSGPLDEIILRPIGRVRSDFQEKKSIPHQGRGLNIEAVIELLPELAPAAGEIRPGDQVWVLTWLHLAPRDVLRVHPRGDWSRPMKGVFSTRSPARPNPIGLHLTDVIEVSGGRITVQGLEVLDGTPVLDIKPHRPEMDL